MASLWSRRHILGAVVCIALLFIVTARSCRAPKAPSARPWQTLEGCTLAANEWNDGDSFHVLHDRKDYIFRLYFVDAPESRTDSQVASRIENQATDFSVTTDQVLKIGKNAAAFTSKRLRGTFTVHTRFRTAPGRSKLPRYYAIVMVGTDDLAHLLVKNGLARIYGTRTPLPDGSDSRTYLRRLGGLEEQAKNSKIGAWRYSKK